MYNAMFVGWGTPVRGREAQASRVFSEFVELLGGWQSKGTIKSFTPVFIAATGGHLQGFFLVTGDVAKLSMVHGSEELRRAVTRAQLIVDNVIVQMALTGDEVGKQMAVFNQNAAELSK